MIFLASSSGAEVPLWASLPFVALLLAIATGPLLAPSVWHRDYPKVAAALGLLTVAYYLAVLRAPDRLFHAAHEYISFIALIGSLFVIAGGVHVVVHGEAKPWTNLAFLAFGALLANVVGTTGAAMLLIRPWIRMNKFRITTFHIVFFIFIVANAGGCLTPIGDPPLFLGYLRGVPFFWILGQAWMPWLLVVGLLLTVFFALDWHNFQRSPSQVSQKLTDERQWRVQGLHNVFFLAVVLGAVLANRLLPAFVPEVIMMAAAWGSWHTTSRCIHHANSFSFEPLREVAWLFAGIFATMIPALDWLSKHAGTLGITTPLQFYWATGVLSAFLDNAPTYLTFLSAEMGLHHLEINSRADVLRDVQTYPLEVLAISLGAVFFGAATYIGNGPNFMVKSIAEHHHVHTPQFFGYIVSYTLPILLPILALAGWIFLAGR